MSVLQVAMAVSSNALMKLVVSVVSVIQVTLAMASPAQVFE